MALNYEVKKKVFGFDQIKNGKVCSATENAWYNTVWRFVR